MISEFENQLTKKEILKGLLIYINRKLWYIILLLIIIAFLFAYSTGYDLIGSLVNTFVIAIIAEIILTLIHMQQFSTNKISTYKLHNDFVEIIGSNGIAHTYQYTQIKSVNTKDVIVLLLSKACFAIVAKQRMNAEQIRILQI